MEENTSQISENAGIVRDPETEENTEANTEETAEAEAWSLRSDPETDMHVRDLDRPDPVKKDLKSRFFRISDAFGDFFFLNLMFILGCLPLVTIGTSFCALHTVMQKRLRNDDGKITKDFWDAYKANLKQGILVWLIVVIYIGVAVAVIYISFFMTGTLATVIICVEGILLILMLFIFPFLFPLVARYENTTFNVFKNAMILSLSEFPTWFKIVFPWAAVILLYLFFPIVFLMTWYLWCMILMSVKIYSEAVLMKKIFDKLEAKSHASSNGYSNAKSNI